MDSVIRVWLNSISEHAGEAGLLGDIHHLKVFVQKFRQRYQFDLINLFA